MEKILIIGGGVYIGTEVIKYFLNKKKIFCNDNFIYGQKNSITKFIKNKILNYLNLTIEILINSRKYYLFVTR